MTAYAGRQSQTEQPVVTLGSLMEKVRHNRQALMQYAHCKFKKRHIMQQTCGNRVLSLVIQSGLRGGISNRQYGYEPKSGMGTDRNLGTNAEGAESQHRVNRGKECHGNSNEQEQGYHTISIVRCLSIVLYCVLDTWTKMLRISIACAFFRRHMVTQVMLDSQRFRSRVRVGAFPLRNQRPYSPVLTPTAVLLSR